MKKYDEALNDDYVVPFESLNSIVQQLEIHKEKYKKIISDYNESKKNLFELNNQKVMILSELNRLQLMLENNKHDEEKILKKHSCPLCNNNISNYTAVFFKKSNVSDNLNYEILSFNEELTKIEKKIDKEIEKYRMLEEDFGITRPNREDIILYNQYKFDEALKRIAELEQKLKVLVEGVKALNEILKIKLVKNEYSIEQYDMELSRVGCLCGFDNDDQFEDVKAMLEVIENDR